MHVLIRCPNCESETSGDAVADHMAQCPDCGERFLDIPHSLQPGAIVGDFTIDRYLGYGHLGEAYLATATGPKTRHVLKFLDRRLKVDDGRLRDALERLSSLGAIGSLRMPQRLETRGDHRFLVQAYVEGETLEAIVRRDGVMREGRAIGYIREAAQALKLAWDSDALPHRYLKPANLVLTADGSIVVTDMGMAELVGEGRAIWAPGLEFGTAHYLSPEQAWDAEMADFRSDIYGLGACLYMLVAGRPPYLGTNPAVLAKLVKPDPIIAADQHNVSLTPDLIELTRVLLAPQSHQRHDSWESLIADLDRVAGGMPPTRRLLTGGSVDTAMQISGLKRVGGAPQKGIGNSVQIQGAPPTQLVDPEAMEIRKVNDGKTREHQSVYNVDVAIGEESKMAITDTLGSNTHIASRVMKPGKPEAPSLKPAAIDASGAPPVLVDPEMEKTRTMKRQQAQTRKKKAGNFGLIFGTILLVVFLGVLVKVLLDAWVRAHPPPPRTPDSIEQPAPAPAE